MLDHFESFVVKASDQVFKITQFISYSNSFVVVVFLLYRYGFYLDDAEIEDLLVQFDLHFLVYIVIYFIRIAFSFNRIYFIKNSPFESVLIGMVVLHGSVNFLFGHKIGYIVLEALQVNNPALEYQHFITLFLGFMVGMNVTEVTTNLPQLHFKPATTFIISFIVLIFGGAGLLMLPAMTDGPDSMPFIDALFTSTSASCVTGLIVVDTGTYFTHKGHWVIMILIQLGGWGIIIFATFFATFLTKGVGIKHQSIMQDYLSSESLAQAKELLRNVIFITLIIEGLGATAIFFSWDEELGDGKLFTSFLNKVFISVFHSVSAFCNAGFSTITDGLYNNDTTKQIRQMYLLHFILGMIVVFGGLGFSTIEDAFSWSNFKKRWQMPWKRWKIGTEISIKYSIILIVIGMIGFMIFEFHQLRDRTIIEAFITAWFQSVVTRTAGFNTMDFGTLQTVTIVLTITLMFIGGCSGSTAGGIKVNTFVLVVMSSYGNIIGQKNMTIAHRNIPEALISRAFAVFMFSFTYNIIAVFLLSFFESDKDITKVVFEQISAFATVGLSMGITANLTVWGKIIIIFSMFVGRVGAITLMLSFSNVVKSNAYRYPDAHFMVG